MSREIPNDLPSYFRAHPETFALRSNPVKKAVNSLLLVVFLVLLVYPQITPAGELWIWRIIAGIGIAYVGISLLTASDFYNIKSQTKIVQSSLKKFDSSATTEQELVQLLEEGNFQQLANLPSKNNQPLQMYVYEDVQGKTFYLLLMKYFSPSDFRGITPVKIVSGADYDKNKMMIKAIVSNY